MAEMKELQTYKDVPIYYIGFARWYSVFTKNEDGTTAMRHFDSLGEAKIHIEKNVFTN